MEHGKRSMYVSGKCRCELCKKANFDYLNERRARLLVEMKADRKHPSHGTQQGYNNGCRCDACHEAMLVAARRKRERKKKCSEGSV